VLCLISDTTSGGRFLSHVTCSGYLSIWWKFETLLLRASAFRALRVECVFGQNGIRISTFQDRRGKSAFETSDYFKLSWYWIFLLMNVIYV